MFLHVYFFVVELVPADIEKEVRNLYLALCELLSHFWRCFPTTTPQQEQKAVKMHDALHRYHGVKLKPFEVIILFTFYVFCGDFALSQVEKHLFYFLIVIFSFVIIIPPVCNEFCVFQDKLIRELSPLSHHLTKHLNQLLNAAYQKFNTWQKLKTHHR